MGRTLLSIADDVLALSRLIDSIDGGELDADVAAVLDEWFKEVEGDETEKIDGYAALIRETKLTAAARREEADRLGKLAAADEAKAKRLTDRLRLYLEMTGRTRLETTRYKVALCLNGGKLPLVMPDNILELLNGAWTKVRYEPDAEAIRAALEAGQAVPGCRLGERGRHLRIG